MNTLIKSCNPKIKHINTIPKTSKKESVSGLKMSFAITEAIFSKKFSEFAHRNLRSLKKKAETQTCLQESCQSHSV